MDIEDHDYDVLPEFEPIVIRRMTELAEKIYEIEMRRQAAYQFLNRLDDETMRLVDDCEASLVFLEEVSSALMGRPRKPD